MRLINMMVRPEAAADRARVATAVDLAVVAAAHQAVVATAVVVAPLVVAEQVAGFSEPNFTKSPIT